MRTNEIKEELRNRERMGEKRSSPKKKGVVLGSTMANRMLKGNNVPEKIAKMGTNEPQKLVEPGKAQDRFDSVKDMLQERRMQIEMTTHQIDNLEKTEEIFERCKGYYEEKYGAYLMKPSKQIVESPGFDQVTNEIKC
jgi:hypothetical protein